MPYTAFSVRIGTSTIVDISDTCGQFAGEKPAQHTMHVMLIQPNNSTAMSRSYGHGCSKQSFRALFLGLPKNCVLAAKLDRKPMETDLLYAADDPHPSDLGIQRPFGHYRFALPERMYSGMHARGNLAMDSAKASKVICRVTAEERPFQCVQLRTSAFGIAPPNRGRGPAVLLVRAYDQLVNRRHFRAMTGAPIHGSGKGADAWQSVGKTWRRSILYHGS